MKPLAHYGSLPGSLVTERPLPVSHVAETISYIQNQVEHHRLRSFQEEYVSFLKKHGIGFEERYLWD